MAKRQFDALIFRPLIRRSKFSVNFRAGAEVLGGGVSSASVVCWRSFVRPSWSARQ